MMHLCGILCRVEPVPELGGVKNIYEKIRQYTLAHLADKDLKAALGVPGKL